MHSNSAKCPEIVHRDFFFCAIIIVTIFCDVHLHISLRETLKIADSNVDCRRKVFAIRSRSLNLRLAVKNFEGRKILHGDVPFQT